tara:strand:+ start:86675 stop:88027 length:1353 start_codon:yes stop_codon:yes gene_type:complete
VVIAKHRVISANDSAVEIGISPGMSSATVRALAGTMPVQLLERDEEAEQRCLQQLCCWAYSITPALHTWRKDCLQLEIGGCLTLFHGLDALLTEVEAGISSRGYRAAYGLAATPKAAWLLSFSDGAAATAMEQPLEQRLAPLPLELLQDFPKEVDSLRRAGLHTFGDLLALPQAALSRRCGKTFTRFLQQVLGQQQDLQADYLPPPVFNDEYWFGYEVKINDELLPAVQILLQSLCRFLRNTQLQTNMITWQLAGIDHQLQQIQISSSTSHSDWKSWYQLTCLRFEQLQLKSSVEGLSLQCEQLSAGQAESIDLFSPHNQREPLASLLDRLRGRLGLQAVAKVGCRDEHLPELALQLGNEVPASKIDVTTHCKQRPFWLMPQPQPLRQQHGTLYWHGALTLLYGPERIEDNWWREAVSRDYYIARARDGQPYWVFYDRLAQCWYIQGIFA